MLTTRLQQHLALAALFVVVVMLAGCVPAPTYREDGVARRIGAPSTAIGGALSPSGPVGDFQLRFADEFEGTELGDSWYPNRWFATQCSAGAGPSELQWYTRRAANVDVADGNLRLTARQEPYSCAEWGGTKGYTSGWVQTGGSRDIGGQDAAAGFTCTIGCFAEARIRMPAGGQTFPAFWLMPVERSEAGNQYPSRPEIDAVEFYRSWTSWEHHLHTTCSGPDLSTGRSAVGPDITAGHHTIGVWWRSDRIDWYVDGHLSWSYTGCGIPTAEDEMYLILNHAIGNAAPDPSPTEPFPKVMLVDYVRVWSS